MWPTHLRPTDHNTSNFWDSDTWADCKFIVLLLSLGWLVTRLGHGDHVRHHICGYVTSFHKLYQRRASWHMVTILDCLEVIPPHLYWSYLGSCLSLWRPSEAKREYVFIIESITSFWGTYIAKQDRPLIFIGHSLGGLVVKQVRIPLSWRMRILFAVLQTVLIKVYIFWCC
jgi:hypothetical protein